MGRAFLRAALVLVAALLIFPAPATPAGPAGREASAAVPPTLLERLDAEELAGWIARLQSFGTRYAYTDRAGEVAQYLLGELEAMGLSPSLQTFIYNGHQMSNVVATLPGRDPSLPVYVLGAHYDSVNGTDSLMNPYAPAPGADDDASGVAAVLGAARALSCARTNRSVVVALFAGEELGRVGSREFVRRARAESLSIAGAVCLDMIGYNHRVPWVDVVSDEGSLWISEAVKRANYRAGVGLRTGTVVTDSDPERWSDHVSFWEGGVDAVCLIESENPTESGRYFEANHYYHTGEDTLDKLNLSLMERIGRLGLATAAALAGLALPDFRPVLHSPPSALLENDSVVFTVSVDNSGEPEDAINVSLTVDGTEVDRRRVNLSGERALLHWCATAGAHDIRFVADPDDRLAEWSEDDNTLRFPAVVARRPELFFSELRVSDPDPIPGRPVQFSVEVSNIGGAAASARVTLARAVEGAEAILDELVCIPAGGSQMLAAARPAPGEVTTYAARITDTDPPEGETSDNERSITLRPHLLDPSAFVLRASPDVAHPSELVNLGVEFDAQLHPDCDFLFDFGDGTGAGWTDAPSVPHVYKVPGIHIARARVRDRRGAEADLEPTPVTIKELAPVAVIQASAQMRVNRTGTFSGASSCDTDGYVVSYMWDFGDGGHTLGAVVAHAYAHPGTYSVRLSVTDNRGNVNFTTSEVSVVNAAPEANICVDRGVLLVAESVNLNASGSRDEDGSVVSYKWELGDGNVSTQMSLVHAYARPGRYLVKLTVVDDRGEEGSTSRWISVFERPASPGATESPPTAYLAPAAALVMLALGGLLLARELGERSKERAGVRRRDEEE
ncbi:MAG: M20/M25/M40 family metallo-hydrolase [Thermoplasmatota archaeon]